MHLLKITALYFQVGSIYGPGTLTLSAGDWSLTINEFIDYCTGPKIVEVPEHMEIEHSPLNTVRFAGVLATKVEQSMKTVFHKVSLHATKAGPCSVCTKNAKRTKEFYQTINPHNKNKDGTQKLGYQILEELRAEIIEWKKLPVTHVRCEK